MLSSSNDSTGQALILAAHGSSADSRVNESLFAVADDVQRQTDFSAVTPAFLDGHPNVQHVLDSINEDHVTVVPVMASQGYYSEVVFPKFLRRPGKTLTFTPPVGLSPLWSKALASRVGKLIRRGFARQDSVVIVVGHGTRKNKNSCRSTIDLVQSLRTQLIGQPVHFAFLDQKPTLHHVLNRWSETNRIVVPFCSAWGRT